MYSTVFPFPFALLCLLLYANKISQLAAEEHCSSGLCNNAGVCTWVNNQPTCRCTGQYFKGEKCTELIDHCTAKPCRNGATCTNAFGQYLCGKCPQGFGGQQCLVRVPDTFTNMHLLLNPIGSYGIKHNMLLTIETLGSVLFVHEIFTSNCLIDTFETKPKDANAQLRFRYSNDLVAVAKSLGLFHARRLPYRRGYYHAAYTTFWQTGDIEVTARVADEQFRALYEQLFVIHILQPSNLPCIPDIRFAHGNNPQEPLLLDIARFNLFEAIVVKRCSNTSKINMQWTIHNSVGTVQLHNFGDTGKTQLKIRPYRLWFNFHGELMQSYMLRVHVVERYRDRTVHTEARCYMFVMSKPVSAIILGGALREFSASQSFVVDGSKSRDFALSPTAEQKMRMVWDCKSTDDPDNRFCRTSISHTNKVHVPAGALKADKSYTFTFYIGSHVNLFETANAKQVIKIVSTWQHNVAIHCVRNCFGEKFAAGKKIHLIVKCSTCASIKAMQVAWSQRGGGNLGDQYRVAFMPPADKEITVEVTVNSAGRSGKATLKLLKNDPPTGGDCSITPASGVEYETDFFIECTGYYDPDAPISFQYIAGKFTFDRTNERLMNTRLPQTSSVKIIVCDFLFACTEKQVSVSVSAMQPPTDTNELLTFLQKEGNSLTKLLDDGDIERAMLLANALTKNAKSLDVAALIHKQLKYFELNTMLEVEQLTKITRNLISPLQPLDNEKVALFADMFKQIAVGFENVITDGEVREILPGAYEGLINEVTDMVTEFSEELENIPEVQSMSSGSTGGSDSLAESYPPIPDFDETVLERVENWLNVIDQSFKCLHYIGVAGTSMHEPGDERYKLERAGMKMEVFSIEGTDELAMQSADNHVQVNMTQSVLGELEHKLKRSHVLLQVISFEKSPFWWYPDEHPIGTNVVYFGAFSAADLSQEETKLKHPFVFRMNLTPNTATGHAAPPFQGRVKTALDMPIFRIAVPMYTALVVKFLRSSTRLRVMLQLCIKPRGYEVRKSAHIAPDKDTYHVVNDDDSDTDAYLAVLAVDAISSEQTFDFSTTLHKCVSWDFTQQDPQWTTAGCVPQLDLHNSDSIICHCYHLSIFAGKIHDTAASETNTDRALLEYVPVNWYMLLGYLLLLLFFVLLFLWAWHNLYNHKGNLLADLDYEDCTEQDYEITVHISTGGQWNAATSANVLLTFVLQQGVEQYMIVQNPENPHLKCNSTCTLQLPLSGDDLAHPLQLYVSHNNAGRYPSWYCRSIVVEDSANEVVYEFEVERWISTEPLKLNAAHFDEAGRSRATTFRQQLERGHILGFQNQPLLGPWKYGELSLNGFERTCIWAVKLAVSICVVAIYYGSTNIETYEEEREVFNNAIFDGGKILLLCILCYIICTLCEIGLRMFIFYREEEA